METSSFSSFENQGWERSAKHDLQKEQKELKYEMYFHLLKTIENDFLEHDSTDNNSEVFDYDSKTKCHFNISTPKKVKKNHGCARRKIR